MQSINCKPPSVIMLYIQNELRTEMFVYLKNAHFTLMFIPITLLEISTVCSSVP